MAIAVLLCYFGICGSKFSVGASAPSADRKYWETISAKFKKGYLVGAIGALAAAISIFFKQPVPAEIGCLVLLAALVFTLAILCRKTGFKVCNETLTVQKRWKLILLIACIAALILTEFVFAYFNSL